jgi:hypothetical protein
MQRKDLAGTMDRLFVEPSLRGATRELPYRNERSAREATMKITLLRVSGPFTVDAGRSSCHSGAMLAGQSACGVVLRAAPEAKPGATGALELQLAPTRGLEPRARRTTLRIGG